MLFTLLCRDLLIFMAIPLVHGFSCLETFRFSTDDGTIVSTDKSLATERTGHNDTFIYVIIIHMCIFQPAAYFLWYHILRELFASPLYPFFIFFFLNFTVIIVFGFSTVSFQFAFRIVTVFLSVTVFNENITAGFAIGDTRSSTPMERIVR